MTVTVKFQGIIADLLKRKSEQLQLPDDATVADLIPDMESRVRSGDTTATLAAGALLDSFTQSEGRREGRRERERPEGDTGDL